ncbi:MAG: hypothetical protein ACTSRS_07640 [Candidatus Helarchaeota archaeon]
MTQDPSQSSTPNPSAIIEHLFDLTLIFLKYLKSSLLQAPVDIFADQKSSGDPQVIQGLLADLETVRGLVSKMVATSDPIICKDFFMYFVDRFIERTADLIALLHPSGKTLLKESTLHHLLQKIQLLLLKIIAIYEVFHRSTYPSLDYIQEYLSRYRYEFINELSAKIDTPKPATQLFQADDDLAPAHFESELVQYFPVVHMKVFRTIFAYYTIFAFSQLEATQKTYITTAIANVLDRIVEFQEHLVLVSNTIQMSPADILQDLSTLYSDLKIVTEFTETFIATHPDLPQNFTIPRIFLPTAEDNMPTLPVYLFTSRECPVCDRLFQVELWPFLQRLCQHLNFDLKLIDTFLPEGTALARGVYDITRTPTLLYKRHAYPINPAKEAGPEPHGTVIRQLLNLFGVLGTVRYEYLEDEETPPTQTPIPPHRRQVRASPPLKIPPSERPPQKAQKRPEVPARSPETPAPPQKRKLLLTPSK